MEVPNDLSALLATLENKAPGSNWPQALQAIWWDLNGDWNRAHNIAQDIPTETGYWMHAYLHRKEGDAWNAGYWYNRAGRPFPKTTLDEEAKDIAEYLLQNI